MHSELESEVWLSVQQTCDAKTFEALIQRIVDSFKRHPGFDPLVRLYASDIGPLGVQVLRAVLRQRGLHPEYCIDVPGYLELRSRLKDHLRSQLQWYLVKGGHATEVIQEDQLHRDLGL
ncbi:hypothetical protein LOY38_14865 [Pseudomonas sp. B21-015]|uniref:hypothetical protein n=1 Tax=Pseudomonas sp. B21-015 TaxID=2895473 RepID=UPI00215FE4D2|nr:hypothetical protein [Pseudomonas sp. B21-015]UVM47730.1 hypothetical protein LOY38_14865 [Pseudomonas sp. B21-015]